MHKIAVDKLFKDSLTIAAQDSRQSVQKARMEVVDGMVSCLLVGRDKTQSLRIAGLLGELGVATTCLDEVNSAVRHSHENAPDVVMLEASSLPSAHEFLRLVRYQNRRTGRPVIIVYAIETNVTQMADSILQGASEFMIAPFDLDLLRFKLTQSGILLAAAA